MTKWHLLRFGCNDLEGDMVTGIFKRPLGNAKIKQGKF